MSDAEHLSSFLESLRRVLVEQRPDCVLAIDVRLRNRDKPIRLASPDQRVSRRQRLIVTTVRMHQAVSGPFRAYHIAKMCQLKLNSDLRTMISDLIVCGCLVKTKGGYRTPDVLPEWFVSDF